MSKSKAPSPKAPWEIQCSLCEFVGVHLGSHLRDEHQMVDISKYQGPLCASEIEEAFDLQFKGVRTSLKAEDLTIEIAGYRFPINLDVNPDDCLPIPNNYLLPEKGLQAKSIRRTARALRAGRSAWAAGPPGTGKDAFFHFFSGITFTPCLCLQIQPNMDIDAWFFSQAIKAGEIYYKEGVITKALRDGYVTSTGRRIPYMILLTDVDRATPSQAEAFRLVADSIQGRIQGPEGETYKVMPGTVIVMTANSTGSGDEKGQCTSSNVMDASLLDRVNRFIQYVEMDWEDVEKILRTSYPHIAEQPGARVFFDAMGKIVKALRKAINNNTLSGTLTQRGIVRWMGDCSDIHLLENVPVSLSLLEEGYSAWLDGLPDQSNREVALQVAKPHFEEKPGRTVTEKPGKVKA